MKKLKIFILSHKVIFIIFLCLLAVGGYFGYQKIKPTEAAIRYVSEAAKKGILISSVSGTGQVSASNQVEIKPKATGVITGLYAKNSQEFKEGGLIAQIDSRTAASKVSEAKASLDNAKLDLETLLAPADPYTLLQAENSLSDAQDSLAKLKINQTNNYQTALDDKSKAENDLAKSYEDAYNSVASTFLDLPDTISGLYSILFSTEVSDSEVLLTSNSNNDALASTFASADYQKRSVYESYADTADTYYRAAKTAYDNTYDSYKVTDRYSTKTDIENLLADTLETVKKMTDAIKSEINMFDFWIEYRTNKNLSIFTKVSDYQSNLSSYTSKINSHLSELITRQRTI